MTGEVLRRWIQPIEGLDGVQVTPGKGRDDRLEPLLDRVEVAEQPVVIQGCSGHDHPHAPVMAVAGLDLPGHRDRVSCPKRSLDVNLVQDAAVYADRMTASDQAPLLISVSGARGIAGVTMTPAIAGAFARAFAEQVLSEE